MNARDRTRLHALDGAVLLFQPSTGASVRIETEATAGVLRRSPRVVLFSLSHACNLACSFCSRDAGQRGRWSESAAFDTLEALWRAGTLEVSFGGGEPLVHAGFVSLLERLHRETTLALHFTTNGTRVTTALAERVAPWVGEIRLSVYEDTPWESALRTLTAAGCRVGVNVMITPQTLGGLPSVMERAATAGACDVAVLRYVGNDPALRATPTDLVMLEQALLGSPLPVRVSNCLLDAMPNVPRLFPGITLAGPSGLQQDCGAGRDFVVVDPDASVRSCSFHGDPIPLGDVDGWLERYREPREYAPAPREGCARPVSLARPEARGAFVYRSFASNNSGDTLLVARFEVAEDAAAFEAEIPPVGDDGAWDAFLREQGVLSEASRGRAPEEVFRLGRTVMASGYDVDDALTEFRALLWRCGATTVYSAVHTHGNAHVLAAFRDPKHALDGELAGYGLASSRRGPILLAHAETSDWRELLGFLRDDFGEQAWTAELIADVPQGSWTEAMKHLDDEPWTSEGYFYVRCDDWQQAEALARTLDGEVSFAGDTVLCSVRRFRTRLGRHMSSAGGSAWWIPRMPLRLRCWMYLGERHPKIALEPLVEAAGPSVAVTVRSYGVDAVAETDDPHGSMAALRRLFEAVRAQRPEVRGGVWVGPTEPVLPGIRRVRHELAVVR